MEDISYYVIVGITVMAAFMSVYKTLLHTQVFILLIQLLFLEIAG